MRARRSPRRASRPLLGTLGAAAGVLLALVVASPASAHAGLTASDPAEGASVPDDLQRVTLTFTEAPLAGLDAGLRIEVRDASGTDESSGEVVVRDATMSKAVDLSAGPHTLLWRYVSPDGHPIDGQVAFTVRAAAPVTPSTSASAVPTPSAPSSAAATAPTTSSHAGMPGHGSPSGAVPWVVGGVVVVLLGAAAAVVVRRRRA
ncbi:copper resistance CopC family protein [Curtobacterium sp. L1-20]|uniref:copper resistance CopC family protein n=1 Tax=Curtobacterium sp. L1-20 TaxID=3138181 RepID=UPI003B5243BF